MRPIKAPVAEALVSNESLAPGFLAHTPPIAAAAGRCRASGSASTASARCRTPTIRIGVPNFFHDTEQRGSPAQRSVVLAQRNSSAGVSRAP